VILHAEMKEKSIWIDEMKKSGIQTLVIASDTSNFRIFGQSNIYFIGKY
jgi:hypothetical protein